MINKGFTQESNSIGDKTFNLEKNMLTVQIGSFGAWVNNEHRIAKEISLRTEAGFSFNYSARYQRESRFIAAPIFTLEPRWYYNINRRIEKDKNIKNNSANFLSIAVKYVPDWFTITNYGNHKVLNQVSFIPKWGIRRSIAQTNFNYEAGFGVGYRHIFLPEGTNSEVALDLHLRLGYSF